MTSKTRRSRRRSPEGDRLPDALQQGQLLQSKQDFLAAVSHYLNTPLSATIGLTELLQDRGRASNAGVRNQLIELLGIQTAELSHLVDNLLLSAESDLGALDLKRYPVDLRRQIDAVVIASAEGQLSRITVSGSGTAIADPDRVVQIVENLLRHAQTSGASNISINIDRAVKRVSVEVADDGEPISEETLALLFEPYHTYVRPGSPAPVLSLGLSVARRLARAQGGDVSHRREGNRTIMELSLPSTQTQTGTPDPAPTVVDPLNGRPTESAIRGVIDSGGPDIAFQPIVDLRAHRDGEVRVIGHESLSRFPYATPPEWFDLASSTGLRLDLELSAIRSAVKDFDPRPANGFLALNLSDPTLLSPKLNEVLDEINDYGRIVLELSDEAAVRSYEKTNRVVDSFRERGIRLAVDDVGAGEIDLWHVLRLNPEIVKIDLCLVRDIGQSRQNAALVRGITAMCADLGKIVIAEGVESEMERDLLAELGVEYAQGYLFGKPGPLRWQSKVLASDPVISE